MQKSCLLGNIILSFASHRYVQGLLGQEVVLTLADGSSRTGTVYTVDPINFSVALLKVRSLHTPSKSAKKRIFRIALSGKEAFFPPPPNSLGIFEGTEKKTHHSPPGPPTSD